MEIFEWRLEAGARLAWYGAARYLRVLECVGTIQIDAEYEAPETDRASSSLIRGIGIDLTHPISRARVKAIGFLSPVAQKITVLVSEFPTTDSRLVGTVSVIDGAIEVVRAGLAFSGFALCAAVAAQYSGVQLWNPVGSGKLLKIKRILLSSASNAPVAVRVATAALASLSVYSPANKNMAIAGGSAAQLRYENKAAIHTGTPIISLPQVGVVPVSLDLGEYILIPEGRGITVDAQTVNVENYLNINWVEEAA